MKKAMFTIVITVLIAISYAQTKTYSTNFPKTESPLSEGGNWICGKTTGLDWSDFVVSASGHANGLMSPQPGQLLFNDGVAQLTGSWASNQWAQATVYAKGVTGGNELELRLRSTMRAHYASGYEIYWKVIVPGGESPDNWYVAITRWNGPVNNFTVLNQTFGSQYGVKDGDVIKATIVGNVITAYKNGVQQLQLTDRTFTSGAPGIGQWAWGGNNDNALMGFTSFSAGELSAVDVKLDRSASPVLTPANANRIHANLGGHVVLTNSNHPGASYDIAGHRINATSIGTKAALDRAQ